MIDGITLTNYRSYRQHRFSLDRVATVVVGPNATGKTNLLESIYVLANAKSFRAKDIELVHHGHDYFRIEATTPDVVVAFAYQSKPKQHKQVDYDKVKRPLSRHVGNFPVVLFEPTDLNLLGGPPSARRRYLDGILAQSSAQYRDALSQYQRILKQRNSLLEGFSIGAVKDQIFAWDLNLTNAASVIVEQRQSLIDQLNQVAGGLYADISGQEADLDFFYVPSIDLHHGYSQDFMEALVTNLTRDLGAGFTTIGPHREDFGLRFNKRDSMTVASRGELRSVILALKLAELDSITNQNRTPILLLDDVFSELDDSRRRYLISRLKGYQSVISTTDADLAGAIELDHKLIETTDLDKYAIN